MRVEYEVLVCQMVYHRRQRASPFIKQIKEPIASFTGDKGYDQSTVYNHVLHHTQEMLKSLYTLVQMQWYLTKENGHIETSMFRRYSMMVYTSGEENRGTINKAKWRIHFIGIRQSLARNYEQEQKRVGKLRLSWGVRNLLMQEINF